MNFMKSSHFFLAIALILDFTSSHASTESEIFFQEIGLSSETLKTLNENDKELIEQAITDAQRNPTDPILNLKAENEIPEGELKILGKGFYDRRTGHSLALAYQEREGCTRLRHVFIDGSSHKAYYLGKDYLLSCGQIATPQVVRDRLKELNKDYKKYRRSENHNRNVLILAAIAAPIAPVLVFATPQSWTVGAGANATMGIYLGAMIVWSIVASVYNHDQLLYKPASAGELKILIDRNGWNWSSRPKKVSHRTFNLYLKFIQTNY